MKTAYDPTTHISRNGVAWTRHNKVRASYKVPGTNIQLLSRPEKMPGASWSLPAVHACPYAVFGEGTICGGCYADNRGRYRQKVIVRAQAARFEWTRQCMKTQAGIDLWVAYMVEAIDDTHTGWFRIHDSGDFFSPTYTGAWRRVCESLSWVRFWAPTRSWQAPWVRALAELNALPNVTVRPSALRVGDAAPIIDGLAAGTTVSATDITCPARFNDHACGECRRCWIQPTMAVSYQLLETAGRGRGR